MKILYIEDNLIDRKNMEWVCRNFSNVELTILKKFDGIEAYLSDNQPDLIFTDRRIGSSDFSSYAHLWSNTPYYVISNTIFESKNLETAPLGYLQKPLTKSVFEGLLFEKEAVKDDPNMDYFAQIPDEELQKEMKSLLIEELESARDRIPIIDSLEELTSKIHNLAGKFSLLGMEESFNQSKELEHLLRKGEESKELLDKIVQSAEKGIEFLKKQNK